MNYTVYYKKIGDLFWKKINNVKGDIIATDLPHPTRVVLLDDESRVEIPMGNDMLFKFSKERFISIKKNMEKEAGQTIPV